MGVSGDSLGDRMEPKVAPIIGDPGDENDAREIEDVVLNERAKLLNDGFDPKPGRSVVFCIAPGEWRPAAIVKSWGSDIVNLVVFLDGNNDTPLIATNPSGVFPSHAGSTTGWKPSAAKANTVGGWLPRIPE